jgi:hypothetical protein
MLAPVKSLGHTLHGRMLADLSEKGLDLLQAGSGLRERHEVSPRSSYACFTKGSEKGGFLWKGSCSDSNKSGRIV